MFKIITADNWVEALARDCGRRHALSPTVADILGEIHAREAERARAHFLVGKPVIGVVVAVVSGVAAQVPQETFAALGWGPAYGWYRLALAGVLLAAILIVAALSPLRNLQRSFDRRMDVMQTVLLICRYDSEERAR